MRKRILAVCLALAMLCALLPVPSMAAEATTEITLWTYPIGRWGNYQQLIPLLHQFEAETGIRVSAEFLTYMDGDDKVNAAIEAGMAPDIIMEGPERLVANWGQKGRMADLSDLLDETDRAEIYPNVLSACTAPNGALYEYPLAMTIHCMAINKTVFEAAGAMDHLDAQTHTWKSTADFFAAVQEVFDYTGNYVGSVFCGGQGGDQGTRALVNNLYGGTFTNPDHTYYTWNSPENIAALQALYYCEGIVFDPDIVGGDEISLFYTGSLNMSFCWNIAQQLTPLGLPDSAGRTAAGDEIMFMAFPSDSTPQLCGGTWGFGVFDNGDDEKIAAAKTFIKYVCDSQATADAIKITDYFPVRTAAEGTDLTSIWADDEIMCGYNQLMHLFGDYYQVTPDWTQARTAWWNMLQQVGAGQDITATVAHWAEEANSNIPEQYHPYHTFTQWVTVKEPTQTQTGLAERRCTVCGEVEQQVLDRLDPPPAPENPFTDVKDTDYFLAPVLWAVEKGITSGTGNGNFSPNATCTRGQVVTFLWRAMGKPAPKSTENPFSDVSAADYFYDAVLWAVEMGITSGTGGGKFSPNAPCTRGQVVTFLWRAMGKPEPSSSENPFSDVNKADYFFAPVLWAVEMGITSGTGGGKFSPSNPCTRGQVVTFLFRAMKTTPVTLTVWAPQLDQNSPDSWLYQAMAKFEQLHPELDITWNLDICNEYDVLTMLGADPASGADVYFYGNDLMEMLIQSGALAALDGDYLAQVTADFSETYRNALTAADGKVYGFPMSPNTWFMYYNKSMLTEEDITSLEACLARGKVAFDVGNSWYLPAFFFAAGGTIFGEQGNDASAGVQFGGEVGLTAVNTLLNLMDHPNFVVDQYGRGYDGLASGEIAAFFSGEWNYRGLHEALGENLGAAALPTVNMGGTPAQLKAYANPTAIGVNPYAADLDLAMEFAALLASSEMQLLRFQTLGIIPAVSSLADHPDVAASEVASAQMSVMEHCSVAQPSISEMNRVWNPITDFGNSLIVGAITRDNAVDQIERLHKNLNP